MSGGGIVSAYLGDTPLLVNSSNTISFTLNNESQQLTNLYSIVTASCINSATPFVIFVNSSVPNFQIVKNGTKHLPTIVTNIKDKDGNDCWKQNGDVLEFSTGSDSWDAPYKITDSKIYPYPSGTLIESTYLYYAEAKFKPNIEDDPNDDYEFSVKVIKEVYPEKPTEQPTNKPSDFGHTIYISTNHVSTHYINVGIYADVQLYEGLSLSVSRSMWNNSSFFSPYIGSQTISKVKFTFTVSQSRAPSSSPWTPMKTGFNIYCTSSAQSRVDTYTEFEKKGYKPIKQDSDSPTLTWSNNYSRTFTEEMSVSISPGKTAYFYIMFV